MLALCNVSSEKKKKPRSSHLFGGQRFMTRVDFVQYVTVQTSRENINHVNINLHKSHCYKSDSSRFLEQN